MPAAVAAAAAAAAVAPGGGAADHPLFLSGTPAVTAATGPAEPVEQLAVVNCSSADVRGWVHREDQRLVWKGGRCATAALPVGNGDMTYMADCGGPGQEWVLNSSEWADTAPNVSMGILLPPHPDTVDDFGWTWPQNNQNLIPVGPITLYAIGVGSRFHGECSGHHNCNFKFNNGILYTYTGLCVVPQVLPTPPTPPPPSPAPPYAGPVNFSSALGSNMVLQRAPARAAVYGPVGEVSSPGAPAATVTVGGGASYTVDASISADGQQWKALLRPAQAGGSYSITVRCTAGCNGSATIDGVTFGDVWYCAGQSNMALPLLHTFSRNLSRDAIMAGKYNNIRIHGLRGNMNIDQPWTTVREAATGDPQGNHLFSFSSTCYYFGESLTDELGDAAPPIGLIHTSVGGSMIEEWCSAETLAECRGATPSYKPSSLWESNIVPYLDTTLKGWVWYQGENNCHGVMGNSAQGVGYGCQLPAMVAAWRRAWSATAGTTAAAAPFGVVTLAAGGSEGGNDIGGMRWSQTANYGTLPSPAMPASFLAHAYDLGDPWTDDSCHHHGCCWRDHNDTTCAQATGGDPGKCAAACTSLNTSYYMGPIHPRLKKPVGARLAQAAKGVAYGGSGAYAGPTLSGCSVAPGAIRLRFNTTLLRGGSVAVKPYTYTSAMQVLVDPKYWCENTTLTATVGKHYGQWMCADGGAPNWGGCGADVQCGGGGLGGGAAAGAGQAWVTVDISSASATEVTVDLAKLGGAAPLALRYAWESGSTACCRAPSAFEPCAPASCPIWDPRSALPANPFVAKIAGGRCSCIPPQVCDA